MVRGINVFRDYFAEYIDQYVLIGGAACDISFHENDMDFRATKDLDMVLVVEALTEEFALKFWALYRMENTEIEREAMVNHSFIVLINRKWKDIRL